jgi:hypothetical protein
MHGECGTQGEGENAYILSVKKSGRKRPLGRWRYRRISLKQGGMMWQFLVNTMHLQIL